MTHRIIRRTVLLLVGLLACGHATTESLPPNALKVLFIGNSLTRANNLPGIVKALADSAGGQPLAVQAVVVDGYSLEDHWNRGDAQRSIASQRWDVVVLQQEPSALLSSRANLIEFTGRFDTEIRRVGARTALYMVWPDASRMTAFDSVSTSYRVAAQSVDGLLFAGGDAWTEAWSRDTALPLYSGDGFHPSPTGSYLVALVIWAELYNGSPVGLPARLMVGGAALEVPPDRALILQRAVAAVR